MPGGRGGRRKLPALSAKRSRWGGASGLAPGSMIATDANGSPRWSPDPTTVPVMAADGSAGALGPTLCARALCGTMPRPSRAATRSRAARGREIRPRPDVGRVRDMRGAVIGHATRHSPDRRPRTAPRPRGGRIDEWQPFGLPRCLTPRSRTPTAPLFYGSRQISRTPDVRWSFELPSGRAMRPSAMIGLFQ